jgi:uncharacterized protein YecT (DUF1311 family)
MTQLELNYCAGTQAVEARDLLDRLLQDLRAHLFEDEWLQLQQVQSEWEGFMDSDCEWEASLFEGGSMRPMVHSLCRRDAYYDRINRLRFLLCDGMIRCPESDAYAVTEPVLAATATPTPTPMPTGP